MNHLAKLVAAAALIWTFAASAAESGPVREYYACNLLPGKTMNDVMAIRDALVKEIEKTGNADLSNRVSLLWTPLKTNGDLDFLWFDMHASIEAMGRAEQAFDASGGSARINAMAANVVDCASGIVTHDEIYQGSGEMGQGPVVVESYRCMLHPGQTLADAQAAVASWQGVIRSLSGFDTFAGYMQTPVISQSPADLFYFLVHPNIADFATRLATYRASPGGMEADRQFASVHRCESALWSGEVVAGSLQ